jgi:hypothetical protein
MREAGIAAKIAGEKRIESRHVKKVRESVLRKFKG